MGVYNGQNSLNNTLKICVLLHLIISQQTEWTFGHSEGRGERGLQGPGPERPPLPGGLQGATARVCLPGGPDNSPPPAAGPWARSRQGGR